MAETNHPDFTEWASRSEMLDTLREKPLIILQSGADGIHKYYELNLPSQYDDFNIVVFSTGHQAPSGFWLEPRSKLILACDSSIYKVDLVAKQVEYSKKLYGIFYQFLQIDQTGACTVLHQLGIVRLQPDGAKKWSVDTRLIEDFVCNGTDSIRLMVMDEPSLDVSLKTGEVTKLQKQGQLR